MSDEFNYRITLNKSPHYLYLLVLLNTTASGLLIHSGLSWGVCLPLIIILLIVLFLGIRTPYPAGNYREFTHQGGTWHLLSPQSTQTFARHRLLLHTGLFMLVKFLSEDRQKVLVIFCDQLGQDDYRHLKLIEKVKQH
ncbi:protein YgfX [Legionella rubrilucens]|uniref:protein YgfX n=1 Tax=Legionella rubrilucens TaxID=458 RepID=UPI00138F3B68|nr:protein YgfX [Legionella rubrilucens]